MDNCTTASSSSMPQILINECSATAVICCVVDRYVSPRERVTDYRTPISGIHPHHLKARSISFEDANKSVATLVKV